MYKTRRKANRIGYILRKNCRLKHVTEGKTDGTRRRGERSKHLLDYLTEKRRYWKSKEGALNRIIWEPALEKTVGLS
jgi:hypothetical protein